MYILRNPTAYASLMLIPSPPLSPHPLPSTSSFLSAVDPPRIITQPVDMLNVIPGNNAVFTVAASGLRLTYTWMQNGSPLLSGGRFVAADEMLTIQNVMPSDVGNYSCLVSNAAGNDTSNPAQLTLSELCMCCERCDHTANHFTVQLTVWVTWAVSAALHACQLLTTHE